jgi:hypothetical protein
MDSRTSALRNRTCSRVVVGVIDVDPSGKGLKRDSRWRRKGERETEKRKRDTMVTMTVPL